MAITAKSLTVMEVEDNADAAQILAMLLEALGHKVYAEINPSKALESTFHKTPDVFLLDIGLPVMDGKSSRTGFGTNANATH